MLLCTSSREGWSRGLRQPCSSAMSESSTTSLAGGIETAMLSAEARPSLLWDILSRESGLGKGLLNSWGASKATFGSMAPA